MKIYLAIPYSWSPQRSFQIANRVAADLMKKGYLVFSPISHSHTIADYLPAEVRTDADWWMKHDLPMIDWADEVRVVCIGDLGHELIEQSKGCQMEIAYAKQTNKPVRIYEYYE